MKKQKLKSLEILYGFCFSFCFFIFMLTEAFINEHCTTILGTRGVNTVYTLGLLCTGAGFLSFPFIRKICITEKSRKELLLIIGLLYLTSYVALLITDRPVIFVVSSIVALLSIGHIGSCVYYNTAMYFSGSQYTGRVIGIGMGMAILLQFIVQKLLLQSIVFLISIFLSLAFVIYFIIKLSKDPILENPLPCFSNRLNVRTTAVPLIVAVVLMSLVSGMIDSVLTAFNAEKVYDIYSGVRLFYALGLILSGIIADIRERRYLPLATVCTILLSSICIFFPSEEVSYFVGTALMYLYSGFYVIFLTVTFLDFAPKSGRSELWAGMGRIVRSFTVALTVLPTLKIYDAIGGTALAVGSCLLSIAILLVLLPHISCAVTDSEQGKEVSEQHEMSSQERLKLYAEHCSLTPRETEVLEKLLITEDDLQRIADSLYISRRMVQRYVSSIYEKTQTKTRLGLFQSYMNFTVE